MPRLVLLDDDGRELASGLVSHETVSFLSDVLAEHRPVLHVAATVARVMAAVGLIGLSHAGAVPGPAPTRQIAAEYVPPATPRRKKR